jgi:tetratricopeptide (TPR) repeat protein
MSDTTETRWERHNEAGRRYFAQGEFGQAEEAFKAAIREATLLGPENLRLAASLSNLGQLKYRQKDLPQAEALFRRSLAIREHVLGADHQGVLQSINNLAALYYARGELEQAEPLFRRALSISETHLGPDHGDVASALNNLARLSFRRSDYAAAAPLLSRLLELKERTLGDEHPEVAGILLSLVKVRAAAREYGEAESLCRRALAIRESIARGAPDPAVASALEALADLCLAQGKQEEHRAVLHRARTIRGKSGGGEPLTGPIAEHTSGPKSKPTMEIPRPAMTLEIPRIELPAMPPSTSTTAPAAPLAPPASPAPPVQQESGIIRFEPPPRTGQEVPQIDLMSAAAQLTEPPSKPRPRPEAPTAPAFSPLLTVEPEAEVASAPSSRDHGESAVAKAARQKTPANTPKFPRRIPTPARLAMAAASSPADGFESDSGSFSSSEHASGASDLRDITLARPRGRRWGVIGGVAAAIALAAVTAWAMVGRDHAEGGAIPPVEAASPQPSSTKSAPTEPPPVSAGPAAQDGSPQSRVDSAAQSESPRFETASGSATRLPDDGRATARRPALSSTAPARGTQPADEEEVALPNALNRIGIDRAVRDAESSAKARVDSVSRTITVKPTFGRP